MKRYFRKKFITVLLSLFFFVFLALTIVYLRGRETEKSIRINEVCTSNFSVSSDNAGNYEDYVELVNCGDKDVYLSGYKIRAANGRKSSTWEIPGITLKKGEYRIIFASKDYEAESEEYDPDKSLDLREFILSGSFFRKETPDELHASVSLSGDGCDVFLINPSGEVIDKIQVPAVSYDTSYSRMPDMTGAFELRSATPGESNEASVEKRVRTLKEPGFSADGGFYDDAFTLTLSAESGQSIYYTLDGSDPDENDFLYTGPIEIKNASDNDNLYSAIEDVSPLLTTETKRYDFSLPSEKVDKATVVRAAAVDSHGNLGKIRTETFFVGLDPEKYRDTAVITLASDPEGLFGNEKGIYVLGDAGHEYRKEHPDILYWGIANYRFHGREWEREADMAVFDEGHESLTHENCGIRIRGNWSRCFPQKSLNIYARKIYSGSDVFKTNLLPGEAAENSVSLFTGGTDLQYKILDRLGASLARGLDFTVMEFRPAHLFLNGEYWGIMYITDKFSNEYLSRKYGVNPDNVVLIKDNQAEDGDKKYEELYFELRYAAYSGLKDDESYRKFCELVDIESMTDYYAYELYIGAQDDWPARNVALWRSIEKGYNELEDGKWRYILYDLNHWTMNTSKMEVDNIEKALEDDQIFAAAFENKDFRRELFDKIRKMEKVFCTPEAVDEKSREIEEGSVYHMGLWYERFYDGAVGETGYREKMQEIRDYFKNRPSVMERLIQKYDGT